MTDIAELSASQSATAVTEIIDRFKPRGLVAHGVYTGAALDTDHFRSATLLTAEAAAPYRPAPDEILVANFRHDNRWFVARIDLDGIEDLIFHLERTGDTFPGVHNQLRVVMREGREAALEPQIVGDTAPPVRLRNVLLTSEGNYAPGTSPRLLRGLEQASIAHMAMSMEQKAEIMSAGNTPHRVRQAYLRASQADKREVVLTYLRHATAVGTDEMFNLLTWNCASPVFQALDRTIDYGLLRNVLATFSPTSMPHWCMPLLALRGILDQDRPLPDYFDEVPD
jgi:hypothetical protein